jgi:pyruvate decarboxylase
VWDYVGFVKSLHNGRGKLYARKVATCGELVEALDEAWSSQYSDHLVFLEVVLDRDDCSKQLLEFGARVAAANSRLPNPQ